MNDFHNGLSTLGFHISRPNDYLFGSFQEDSKLYKVYPMIIDHHILQSPTQNAEELLVSTTIILRGRLHRSLDSDTTGTATHQYPIIIGGHHRLDINSTAQRIHTTHFTH